MGELVCSVWQFYITPLLFVLPFYDKMMIFERKIMRKILGPMRSDDGYWRIETNQEINDILEGQNIIGFIKK